MYTKRDYFNDENPLISERYFVYQNAPSGAPKPAEAAPSKPGEEPGKPPTFEDARDKIKIVKDSIDAAKAKHPKGAERSEKIKVLGKKLDEIDKKIQEAEKEDAEKRQKSIEKINRELDAIISEISAPAVAVPAKPATAPASAPAPAPAAAPAAAPTQPPKAPDKPAKAPGLSESDKAKEKAFHEDVIKEVEKASTEGKTCSEIIKNVKLAMEKIKDKPAFKSLYEDFNKQLDAAQAKVNKLRSFGSEKKGVPALKGKIEEALGKYRKKVDEVLSVPKKPAQAPAAAPTPAPAPAPAVAPTNAPTANPDKPSVAPNAPNKPSAAPESQDETLNRAEKNLEKYLNDVIKNPDKFPELRLRLTLAVDKILQRRQIDLKDVKERQVIDLPGGYSMAIAKWSSDADKMPNAMIYKGRDLVCYKDYGILNQARPGQIPDAGYEAAQVIKCFNQFPKSFRTMKSEDGKNDKFKITNEEDFVLMGIELARYSRQDRPWTTNLASGRISYNPADKLLKIKPKESAFQIVFNPKDPGKIGVIGEGASKIKWENISSYIETAEDKEARVKEENTEAEKHLKDTVKQKMEERKESTRKVKEDTEKENKALHEKLEKSVDQRFLVKGKEIVKFDSSDPSKFKIESGNDKTAKSLIDGTKIDQLINLKGQSEAVKITIKDGSGEREGLYYPGQDTCYELKDGKQTDNRLKFHDGDTISVKFAKPSSAEHSQVRSVDTGKVEKPGADWEGKYDEVFEPAEGISIMKKGGKFGFVDQTGKELASPKYELVYNFREGMAKVKFDGKFGFVDKTGKEVVPPKYDNVSGFKDGVARIRVGEKRGFIDKTGTEVIPPKYDKADLFENGKAKVKLNGKEFYIDKTGKETQNT